MALNYTTTTVTIATGGVAQDLIGANSNRKYLMIFLGGFGAINSLTNYIDFGTTASTSSIPASTGNTYVPLFISPSGNPIFPGGIMSGDLITGQSVSILTDSSGTGDVFTVIEGV